MTFLRSVIPLYLLFEHDLRANAFRVCRERKPVSTFADHALERSASAKLELLHAVELTFRERDCIVEAQRSERRGPDQADTHRCTDDVDVVVHQSRAGSRRIGEVPW